MIISRIVLKLATCNGLSESERKFVGALGMVANWHRSRRRRYPASEVCRAASVRGSDAFTKLKALFAWSMADAVASDWDPSLGRSVSYLVDPASSHMLVSKIKPCMSKHKPLHGEAANGSLQQP